ncbi:cupin domain-containing protein [Actinopolymorpha pittospori]|uniref:Quercetin dioxygenase-like cupin family protein n=1 Tax=Actinopolymorpha pittospori TaxID=648752 RepID=A0A927RDU1_9ACTN|nr:cupin domain-containing protein [Actinopolymorpha pittospori]MBE1608505.1 quercetin dioxygenase-like cupin family protein [Actinopolymorpha pittospori]
MIAMRIAGGLLAVATLTAATACATSDATSDPPANAKTPTAAVASKHPAETLTPLLQQSLPKVKGKTFTSAVVNFPPNARAKPHRHGEAFVYAYVLQGSVRSELAGKPVTAYHQGQNWVEPPGAHHVLTENTSRTKPAKLLVVFVSDPGAKLKVDD